MTFFILLVRCTVLHLKCLCSPENLKIDSKIAKNSRYGHCYFKQCGRYRFAVANSESDFCGFSQQHGVLYIDGQCLFCVPKLIHLAYTYTRKLQEQISNGINISFSDFCKSSSSVKRNCMKQKRKRYENTYENWQQFQMRINRIKMHR